MNNIDSGILSADISTLSKRLHDKSISSVELTQMTLDAIAKHDDHINSFISVNGETALEAAKQSDRRRAAGDSLGVFDGLTCAIKDNIDVAGFATTAGLNIEDGKPIENDAPCIAKLRNRGAIILGKLNMDEAALGATNQNPHHGNCHNPKKQGYTPGGSSGGSAAAVAAGFAAFTLGSDSMGSIRIPASYCGVAGMKPTYGFVSVRGSTKVSRRLDHIGPLARSPRDLSAILEIISGFDTQCPQSRRVSIAGKVDTLSDLKLMIPSSLNFADIEEDVVQAFFACTEGLEKAGVNFTRKTMPEYDFSRIRRAGLLVCEAEMRIEHARALDEHPQYFSHALKNLLEFPLEKSAVDLCKADLLMDKAFSLCETLLGGVDCALLPAAPQSSFAMTGKIPPGQADLTAMANMSGYPAVCFNIGVNAQGLPVGAQIIGRPGSDFVLADIAQHFSKILGLGTHAD